MAPRVYHLPRFPLVANIWRAPTIPPVGSPDLVVICQLRWLNRGVGTFDFDGFLGNEYVRTLYVPKLTDIRQGDSAHVGDTVECPGGSGRFYAVLAVDDVAKGFSNEFRAALMGVRLFPNPPLP